MGVLLRNDHPKINIDSLYIEGKILKVMDALDCHNHEVSILFTGDPEIQKLNLEFRGIDHPTDVLSFPQEEGPSLPRAIILGDVVVSLDTAQAQAKEHELSLHEEITLLLIHGILHLLGYDHEISELEDKKMRVKTRELFNLVFPGKVLTDSCNY